MSYVIAVIALGLTCALWVLVQRDGDTEEGPCRHGDPDCRLCGLGRRRPRP